VTALGTGRERVYPERGAISKSAHEARTARRCMSVMSAALSLPPFPGPGVTSVLSSLHFFGHLDPRRTAPGNAHQRGSAASGCRAMVFEGRTVALWMVTVGAQLALS